MLAQQGIKHYKELIECSRKGAQEKKLTAQLLGKYFNSYPSLQEDATEAIVDLCEEDDITVCIHDKLAYWPIINYF